MDKLLTEREWAEREGREELREGGGEREDYGKDGGKKREREGERGTMGKKGAEFLQRE